MGGMNNIPLQDICRAYVFQPALPHDPKAHPHNIKHHFSYW